MLFTMPHPSRIRRLNSLTQTVVAVLLGFSLLSASGLNAADVVQGGTKSAMWEVIADPGRVVEWPETLATTIPQPAQNEEILFPTTPSEFCLVGLKPYESDRAELWNLATGKRVGSMKGSHPQAIRRALSPDGKLLAIAVLDRARANDIEVWSLETGKRLSTFTADGKEMSMTILDFAGPGEVLTYTLGQQEGKFGHHLRLWNATDGSSLRQFDLPKNLSGDKKYDISPGRRFLASIVYPEVLIYDLKSGKVHGSLAPAVKLEGGQSVSIDSVRFSPDGTEIALLSEGSHGALIAVYDLTTGDQKFQHEMTASQKTSLQNPASYKGPHLEFVTSPPGFLWYGGAFLERDSGLMIWTYRQGLIEFSHWNRILTPAGLIVSTGGHDARKIRVLPFPSEKLAASIAAYRGDAEALVKPGEKVKVKVEVKSVRFGKPAEAKESIERVLAERLADDGLEVSDEGTTTMTVQYKEAAGKTLQEVKGGSLTGRGGVPTGKTIQSTAGELKMKWASSDGKTIIFQETVNLDPSQLILREEGDITNETARKQVFEILKIQLAGLPMPYFVPTDTSLITLPTVTASEMAVPASPQAAIKAKIEAKKKKLGK